MSSSHDSINQSNNFPSSVTDSSSVEFERVFNILKSMLEKGNGCVCTRLFRNRIEQENIDNVSDILTALKLRAASDNAVDSDFPIRHSGRSFYTLRAFQEIEKETARDADQAEEQEIEAGEDTEKEERKKFLPK